jgi:hypothetical protein
MKLLRSPEHCHKTFQVDQGGQLRAETEGCGICEENLSFLASNGTQKPFSATRSDAISTLHPYD